MTFNSSQQERLLAALERIADTTVRIADALEAQSDRAVRYAYGQGRDDEAAAEPLRYPTDTPSTKGPYR